MSQALRWARELDGERVWAIEDCRHVSRRLELALVAAGESGIRVAPGLMGQSRRGERRPGKSDQIDALAVARAVVREGVERFPAAYLDEAAMEIRLLCDHREDLIAERTRAADRLRWHLVALCPELEAQIPGRCLDHHVWLERVARKLQRLPRSNFSTISLCRRSCVIGIGSRATRSRGPEPEAVCRFRRGYGTGGGGPVSQIGPRREQDGDGRGAVEQSPL